MSPTIPSVTPLAPSANPSSSPLISISPARSKTQLRGISPSSSADSSEWGAYPKTPDLVSCPPLPGTDGLKIHPNGRVVDVAAARETSLLLQLEYMGQQYKAAQALIDGLKEQSDGKTARLTAKFKACSDAQVAKIGELQSEVERLQSEMAAAKERFDEELGDAHSTILSQRALAEDAEDEAATRIRELEVEVARLRVSRGTGV